jgi:CBS domain-containing protein
MKVEQIMSRPVKTCSPDDSLDVAARLMWENDCGCIPVVDNEGHCLAMITDRDVCMAAYTQGRTLGEMRVNAAMSGACHGIGPHDPVAAAERMMQEHQIRRLPVLQDGQLVGIVSLSDITTEAARNSNDVTLDEVAVTLSEVCKPHNPSASQPQPMSSGKRRQGAVALR